MWALLVFLIETVGAERISFYAESEAGEWSGVGIIEVRCTYRYCDISLSNITGAKKSFSGKLPSYTVYKDEKLTLEVYYFLNITFYHIGLSRRRSENSTFYLLVI